MSLKKSLKMIKKIYVIFLQELRLLSSISMRLTKLTGKSKETLHPKHLIDEKKPWFIKHLSHTDYTLDVGCANGQYTIKTAKFVKKITGMDVNKEELEKAIREAKRKKIKNTKFIIASAQEKFPFKSETFDKVFFFDVLEHLQDEDFALSEIQRVLRPKGFLLLTVPNNDTSWKRLQRSVGLNSFADPDHKREYSRVQIERLITKHDFKVLEVNPVVFDTPWAPFFDLIGGFSLLLYSKLAQWKREKALENPRESNGFEVVARKYKS